MKYMGGATWVAVTTDGKTMDIGPTVEYHAKRVIQDLSMRLGDGKPCVDLNQPGNQGPGTAEVLAKQHNDICNDLRAQVQTISYLAGGLFGGR